MIGKDGSFGHLCAARLRVRGRGCCGAKRTTRFSRWRRGGEGDLSEPFGCSGKLRVAALGARRTPVEKCVKVLGHLVRIVQPGGVAEPGSTLLESPFNDAPGRVRAR